METTIPSTKKPSFGPSLRRKLKTRFLVDEYATRDGKGENGWRVANLNGCSSLDVKLRASLQLYQDGRL